MAGDAAPNCTYVNLWHCAQGTLWRYTRGQLEPNIGLDPSPAGQPVPHLVTPIRVGGGVVRICKNPKKVGEN